MANNNDVIELLDILYGMVTEAWGVPLGNDKCIIEREKAIDIISEIKANLPSSIAEAQRLVSARDEFIGNAKREAENIMKSAQAQARQLVSQEAIYLEAKNQANDMVRAAQDKIKELKKVTNDYVDDSLRRTEEAVAEALSEIRNSRSKFRALVNPQAKNNSAIIEDV